MGFLRDMTPEKNQRLLWHSIIPFTYVLLHLQFHVHTILRFCFISSLTVLLHAKRLRFCILDR